MGIPKIAENMTATAQAAAAQTAAATRAPQKPAAAEAAARPDAARDQAQAMELAAEERRRIAERLQEIADASGRELEFRVDEESDRMIIVVRDQRTGELIRQIPDATALRISQRLASQVEAMRSILFEGRV